MSVKALSPLSLSPSHLALFWRNVASIVDRLGGTISDTFSHLCEHFRRQALSLAMSWVLVESKHQCLYILHICIHIHFLTETEHRRVQCRIRIKGLANLLSALKCSNDIKISNLFYLVHMFVLCCWERERGRYVDKRQGREGEREITLMMNVS